MTLSKIISITGMSGLYKTIAQSKNGVIVESLVDKKRMPVYNTQKVNSLDTISVYTTDKDIPLKDVFKKISEKENKGAAIDHKTEDAGILKYFGEVLPEYDKERVHISDIRKMIQWYNILQAAGMTEFEEKEASEEEKNPTALPGENIPKVPTQHIQQSKLPTQKPHSRAQVQQKQTVRKTGSGGA